ncbi:hypothetical protein [Kitasatospora griseola]|uniref:hypothetical protein n=1 Tax=Kitasatospora griseola TaxID=2064 RepID=UPI0038022FB2
MARKTVEPVKYVDLLLRKSQIVRGTTAQDILSLKAQETKGRAWAKKNKYVVRRIWRENLSAYSRVSHGQTSTPPFTLCSWATRTASGYTTPPGTAERARAMS